MFDFYERAMMATLFGGSCGLLVFAVGFLLLRTEERRRRLQAEDVAQIGVPNGTWAPGSLPPREEEL